jgi:VanZ family protein
MSSAPGNTAQASSPSVERLLRGRFRGSLAICVLLIAYASLYPFVPPRLPGNDALALFFHPRYLVSFDIILNALAYVPLGALACLVLRREGETARSIAKAVACAAAFSLAMELCQLFVPWRVASIADVAANAAGALAGALMFAEPAYTLVTRPLGALRERVLIPGPWGDAGLVLVVLWLIAQLNPALPFFEAGNIAASAFDLQPLGTLGTMDAMQVIAVALSVCGFGLFVSVLLSGPHGGLRFTLLLLTVALWLKFVTAAMMLKPHMSAEWVNEVRVIGLASGLLIFIPMRRLARPTRIYLGIVLVLAGALFAKILGAFGPLEDLLRLFNWPHGQLASFASLTRYLHEVWPAAAIGYLIALFIRQRRADPVK